MLTIGKPRAWFAPKHDRFIGAGHDAVKSRPDSRNIERVTHSATEGHTWP